jgi:hypothetical protein
MMNAFRRVDRGEQRDDIRVNFQGVLFVADNEFFRLIARLMKSPGRIMAFWNAIYKPLIKIMQIISQIRKPTVLDHSLNFADHNDRIC